MQLHQIKPIHKRKKKKRVGRGGKRGNYCQRGIKGQKARAGRKLKPIIREIIKKYPKLRGYKFKAKKENIEIVNLCTLEKKFQPKETVNPQILIEKKIIRKKGKKAPKVKILAKGKLTKPLIIENCLVSKKAKQIIESLHGVVK